MDGGEDYFIIGGAAMYEAFMDKADSLYLTEIDDVFPADTFFPEFDRTSGGSASGKSIRPKKERGMTSRLSIMSENRIRSGMARRRRSVSAKLPIENGTET